ncbi:uncharacterized protein MEPE_01082 [Melanopsichium pennsylvanicum]|uniref:Uncharacterized protein n=2 Tax=Melanopsichium pennsylvanicum TaxID=63383 RepID=A0AAJ4XIN3_9BASI|nr:conserved hypothetical protein [Melanopsichium pennsylvanicum 4]SNX82376.1 uncharacterized protein MEPE_01082 [Melanopsichium pennsylvanicum]
MTDSQNTANFGVVAAHSSTSASAPAIPPPYLLAAVRPTPLHALEEHPLTLQDTRSSFDSPVGAHDTISAHEPGGNHRFLPTRAPDEDAQTARDKLDRIAKAQKTKRNWAKSTGITLVFKAFGRNDRRQRRRRHGISSDEDSSDSSSKEDDAVKEGRGEVKLMITGNPVVTKVFDAATRARDRFRSQIESPEVSPQNEESPFRFSMGRPGSSLARRFRPASTTPPPEAALKTSIPYPSGELPFRRSMDSPSALPERPKSRARQTLNPELLVVDEEGQQHQATELTDQKGLHRPEAPSNRSPNSRTPNSLVSSPPSSPGNQPAHRTPSSFVDGAVHDEPDHQNPEIVPTRRNLPSPDASSGSGDSSDDDLDESAIMSDSDEGGDNMLKINMLNLEHGETLTKEQIKRRKKLIRREIQRRKANGEPVDDLIHLHGKVGQLSHKVSSRVSKGIHYASSQSRNRRAMDRYSPHPMALSLQTSDLPRSSSAQSASADRGITPFSPIAPSVSRTSNAFGQRRESVATIASSRRSSMTVDEDDIPDGDGGSSLRRFSTIDRSFLSSRNSIRKYLHAPNMIKRRRRKKWEAEMTALEQAAEAEARKADPEAELDNMLAKYAEQQAPSDATKVKYEFDVLYENQRGLLVFGIPKFSPRTLFQWDPSPWTSSSGKPSPYNIANAQLPDPSWEWAYQEWYIDMTGDVDEAGWQYSGNFGRRFWPNVHFPHGKIGLPKTGADGILEMNARLAEKEKKRKEKESTKEDGGFEAIKRSARARSSKWTGTPDAWTFVRRRRWIRLRRRKPLAVANNLKLGEGLHGKAASPAHEVHVSDLGGNAAMSPGKRVVEADQSDDEQDKESSLGGSEESDSSSEDDDTLYAPAYGRQSGFLPRRLPGDMSNGRDATKSKDPRARRRARKHAREFTGTIRELKSLLPSIIAMDREAKAQKAPTGSTASQSSYKWAMLKINKIDARNPFISWHFVKHRLQDEDMAFAATTLRTMERKFQQRQLASIHKRGETATDGDAGTSSHAPIPSSFGGPSRRIRFDGLVPIPDAGEASTSQLGVDKSDNSDALCSRPSEPFAANPTEGHELTREALIEINFARVLRVLRACKIDRQRMDLWKLWLGVVSLEMLNETARKEDLAALGLLVPSTEPAADHPLPTTSASPTPIDALHFSGGSSFRYRHRAEKAKARWRASVPSPDASDVWDVLERKLDAILLLFEFQSNRAQLIRLLLTVHARLHPDHVYRDRSLRANPVELSPAHVHGEAAEMGGNHSGGAFGSRLDGWKRAGLPRLEFFSDLERTLAALPGNDATTNSQYILSQLSPDEELDSVAMPLDHHNHHQSSNALIDKLEAEALSEKFLDHEKIPSGLHEDGGDVIKRPTSATGQRLSVFEHGDRMKISRSPSPIVRAPSVPLPYRHSLMTSTMALNRGSCSTQGGSSSMSILERQKGLGESAKSSPATSVPGVEDDSQRPDLSFKGPNFMIAPRSEHAKTQTHVLQSTPRAAHKATESNLPEQLDTGGGAVSVTQSMATAEEAEFFKGQKSPFRGITKDTPRQLFSPRP